MSVGDGDQNSAEEDKLRKRVAEWLQGEGYPTEYKTANIFRQNEFSVNQGGYVVSRDPSSGRDIKRELDVVASKTVWTPGHDFFLRVSHVVECKWSRDKPWVVFTSPSTRMAPTACAAQSIASIFCESIIWTIAGDPILHALDLFATPEEGGFGGRQALANGQQDHFYSALKSVVENTYSHVAEMDRAPRADGGVPRAAEIAFPVVVVDGRLFKASFDPSENSMKLDEADHVRCHWKGSTSAVAFSTVDIVTLNGLEAFVDKRARETRKLLGLMMPIAQKIQECAKLRSLEGLEITQGGRGMLGLPTLLREIARLQAENSSDAEVPD
ncbi:hypothetical protein ASF70_07485 [Rhizobium sp. Leaf321]|uniref:hypothetical protein n=1 Tax=Rhizobium sp. Leaf321 TaxID=1736335 RepID=UPI000715FE72|nr:hypothetical protein [Rhizobium sp. Leaf321]KQQ73645.1 hypothetical protein ASF70_07485 [Rhizobium sp. Leaf321]